MPPARDTIPTVRECLTAVVTAVGLTALFWPGLWRGEGLIGGDTYSYYFPQKVVYAGQLKAGELPLWNPLVGHGYPMLAESQTGVFSPFNLIGYRFLSINAAYNAVQLLHYALCFLFTWLYARRLGLRQPAALFAALVFTYAWFPYRISLEWAITTGAWFPAALWCAESLLQTRRWRYALGLSVVCGLQLLAGHFHLAFLTVLTLALYVPARLWFVRDLKPPRWRAAGLCATGVVLGYALAAVQLAPTWELKQRSQRATAGQEQDPRFGHTPVWSWSQTIAPWMWYGVPVDWNARLTKGEPGTNGIEAHLYFGLIPLLLVPVALIRRTFDRIVWLWLFLGLAALCYTPGWMLPVTEHLPGFSFFLCPGRYSLIATFAVAVLSAKGLNRIVETGKARLLNDRHHDVKRPAAQPASRDRREAGLLNWVVAIGLLALTAGDLLWVARQDPTAAIIPDPPIDNVERSDVRKILTEADRPVRLFSRGANLPTNLGVASTPVYLGLGPAEYFDDTVAMPEPLPFDTPPTPAQIAWLRRAGVTHVLSFSPLDESVWPVRHLWSGRDAFLNRAWGRREPLHLYELEGSRGRVAWTSGDRGSLQVKEHRGNFVRVTVDARQAGRVVLTDLNYPGWQARIDGEPVPTHRVDGMFRSIDVPAGRHEIVWRYQPASFTIGVTISLATVLFLAGLALVRWRGR